VIGAIYLAVIGLSAIGVHGLVKRFSLPVSRQVLLPVTVVTTVAFLLVDAVGIWRGWFATPLSSTLLMLPGRGALDAGLPIEEVALLAALAALVVVLMSAGKSREARREGELSARRVGAAILIGITVGSGALLADIGGEYTAATAGLAAGALLLAGPLLAHSQASRWSVAIFLGLTLVFDNIMCAAELFYYSSASRSGVMLGYAPVEDVLWAAAFVLFTVQLTASAQASKGRWWRLLLSSRPVSWINTALPFAGGALAAGAGEAVGAWFLPLVIWWGVAYNLYLYGINDLYDLATDRKNPRKGGAEGALLQNSDLPTLRLLLIFAASTGALFLLTGTDAVPIWCLLGVAFATAYSAPWFFRARAVPILDAVISATHFVIPAVAGLALGGELQQAWIAPLAAFFFWNMGSHVVGALQDVDADRRSRIATVGTLFGVRGGGLFAIALYAVAGLLLLVQGEPLQRIGALLPLASILSLLPLVAGRPTHEAARAAWRRFMLLNLFLGAGAAMLIIRSLVGGA
jgi:lycopene cyclase domain-containing protein